MGLENGEDWLLRPVQLVGLENGEDWLLRPVLSGMCKYESLIDGTLSLEDIACMNDALAVQQENKVRVERALLNSRG